MGKIIVFGDSIVYGKWDSQGGWVVRLRRYIDEKCNIGKRTNFQVFNMGIPGEIASVTAERFETELKYRISPRDNNLVLLAVGVNDSCPNNLTRGKQTKEEEFKKAFEKMISEAHSHNCKIACIGLAPVNPAKSKGLKFSNEEVKKYDGYLSDICNKQQVTKLDWFDELLEQGFPRLLVDAGHPNDKGHKIMSEKIIYFLNNNRLIDYCG